MDSIGQRTHSSKLLQKEMFELNLKKFATTSNYVRKLHNRLYDNYLLCLLMMWYYLFRDKERCSIYGPKSGYITAMVIWSSLFQGKQPLALITDLRGRILPQRCTVTMLRSQRRVCEYYYIILLWKFNSKQRYPLWCKHSYTYNFCQ